MKSLSLDTSHDCKKLGSNNNNNLREFKLQPNVQHARGTALNAQNFPFFRGEYAPTAPPGYATVGSELIETYNEPPFRAF